MLTRNEKIELFKEIRENPCQEVFTIYRENGTIIHVTKTGEILNWKE